MDSHHGVPVRFSAAAILYSPVAQCGVVMGAAMAGGVAVANSMLLITSARDNAALEIVGLTQLRRALSGVSVEC